MINLRIAGSMLIAQAIIIVVSTVIFMAGELSIPQRELNAVFFIIQLLLGLYAIAMLKVGIEVFRANYKYQKTAYVFGALCVFTTPWGVIFGVASLIFQVKGKCSYVQA